MEDKVYWKGIEELENTTPQNDREFADELPVCRSQCDSSWFLAHKFTIGYIL